MILPPMPPQRALCCSVARLLLYGAGFTVYHFKIPERFAPGAFDVLFNSHNLVRLNPCDVRMRRCGPLAAAVSRARNVGTEMVSLLCYVAL